MPSPAKPFAQFLAGIDRGRVLDEADAKLREVIEAVHDHRARGTLTIKLTVAPRKGDTGTVDISASTSHTVPQPPHEAVFFYDHTYSPTRDDPTMEPLISRDEAERGESR